MMTRLTVLIMAVLLMDGLLGLPGAVAESDQKTGVIPAEDYAFYDQVVTSKFLTSADSVGRDRTHDAVPSLSRSGGTDDDRSLSGAGVFRWRTAIGPDPGIHLGQPANQAGSKDDFTLVSATGSRRGKRSKSRRCPWPVQSRWLARDRFKRRRSWIVWPSLAWREAFATIMR